MSPLRAVALVAGEVRDPAALAPIVDAADLVIAVDGGIVHAQPLGARVSLIVGDLDSAPAQLVTAERDRGAQVLASPREKDETDLELALQAALSRGIGWLTAVGVHGGRVDHELANVALLGSRRWHESGLRVDADDGRTRLHFVHDSIELNEPVGTTISVLALGGPATGVFERGMRWDLSNATLAAGSPQGMSNVAVAKTQVVVVATGTLLVVIDGAAPDIATP